MEIKYPGLLTFCFTLFPLPAFYLLRLGFSFLIFTSGPSGWCKYTHQGYWFFATLWAFSFPLLGVSRFVYWWATQNAVSPIWDKGLGSLSILSLFFVYILYSAMVGVSLSGRGL
jgi:hypothetical protein